jgi:hypothetical protein
MNDIKFYNICPAGIESGGPELAHQMCNTLVRLGYKAQMYYIESNMIGPSDVSASARYLKSSGILFSFSIGSIISK